MASLVSVVLSILLTLVHPPVTTPTRSDVGVTVTPTVSTMLGLVPHATGYTVSYVVTNTYAWDESYWIRCNTTGGATCTGVPTDSIFLPGGASITINVALGTPGANAGGIIRLNATGAAGSSGTVTWSTGALRARILTPGPDSTHASIAGARPVIRAELFPASGEVVDTTQTALLWQGTAVGGGAVLANRRLVEWEVDSARAVAPGDSAEVVVHACLTSGICENESRWLHLDGARPVLDFLGSPVRSTGGGFSAGFGPGVALSGVDIETGFATPAYVSMGAGRSAALVYSTRTSYPRALVATDVRLPWPSGTPDQLKAVLFDAGVRKDSVVIASPSCVTGGVKVCRVVLQADYASGMISGGVSRRWLTVELSVTSAGTTKTTADSVEVVLVDRRDSPYGSGWWAAGASRLYGSGNDRVLVGPSGGATIYRGSGDSLYLSPPGSITVLVKTTGGWELRPRGTTAKVLFDTNGRITTGVDASGNRDSIAYDGSGRVATLVDPIGKRITWHYGSVTGKLDSLVSLPGEAGARTSRVTIDTATNQLRSDSLSSPATHRLVSYYAYRTYGSVKGTAQLQDRWERYGADSVRIVYDSTAGTAYRPIQTRLLAATAGGTVPIVTYRAAELQGWHSVRSLDSLYVEFSDPLGHWTRSRMNRFAEAITTWDQIGALGRNQYDAVGRPLWGEGKNGDSSRVYTDYDSFGRVARTYILRSPTDRLRIDSLVYDASHRVVKRIDAQGQADSIGYDASGRPNYSKDQNGAVTRSWYRSDGQVDSIRLPLATASQRIEYDGTWHSAIRSYTEANVLVSEDTLDDRGRAITTTSAIKVETVGGLTRLQGQRRTTYLDAANRADSTTIALGGKCDDPCDPDVSLVVQQVAAVVRDSIGRGIQTVITGTNAATTSYLYDRLDRVVRRSYPGGTKDSTIYDLVGNVVKGISRRGDTLQSWFDSRGRPDSTKVPRYGTIRRSYGGPQDQLTSLYVVGYVDSIGGVNPARGWAYDARGRLKSDTLWTGGVGRVTAHTYDAYERPATSTDALGTWTTKYPVSGSAIDTLMLLAPSGDSLRYVLDDRGRPASAVVLRGTSTHASAGSWGYSATGELTTITQSVPTVTGFTGYTAGTWQALGVAPGLNLGTTLASSYTKNDGSGGATETQRDTMRYDGRHRLTSWAGYRGSTQLATESYTFDLNGNLGIGDTRTYASGTNRLLTRTAGGVTATFVYDTVGNLVKDSLAAGSGCVRQFSYDPFNRLSQVEVRDSGAWKVVARYGYDVLGNRIARKVYRVVSGCSGGLVSDTRYAVQGAQVTFETNTAGDTIARRYLWGPGTDNLVALQVGNSSDSTFYSVKDKLGSIRAWVRKDGAWRWAMRYRPYGAALDSTGTALGAPYRWTGREYDPETGFYFLRARYYDPRVGRFTQEDPIGVAGGANLYAYVGGQPLEARDPSGLLKDFGIYAMSDMPNLVAEADARMNAQLFQTALWGLGGLSGGAGGLALGSGTATGDPSQKVGNQDCAANLRRSDGLCPGGLTDAQYDAIKAAAQTLDPAYRDKIMEMLDHGRISVHTLPGNGAGLSSWWDGSTIIDPKEFALIAGDMGFLLAHEASHHFHPLITYIEWFADQYACARSNGPYAEYQDGGTYRCRVR